MMWGAAAILSLVASADIAPARAEPPIRGPEDAACRAEARAKVFSAPNPRGLGLEEVGRGLYYACMRRTAQKPARERRHHGR